MFLLPYDKLRFQSSKTKQEILSLLENNVEPGKISFFRMVYHRDEHFIGEVNEEGFKIVHTVRWNNSFYPIILGTFYESQRGLEINITIRPSIPILIYLAIIIIIALAVFNFTGLYVWSAVLAAYLLLTIGYRLGAGKSKAKIRDLLGEEDANNMRGQ